MNWFERYGIPGAYFMLLLATLGLTAYWADCMKNWNSSPQSLTGIVTAGAAASIPLGYVLSVIAQVFYYTPAFRPWHMCAPAWEWAWTNRFIRVANESEPPCGEWRVEAGMAIVTRWKHHYQGPDGLSRSEFLQKWFAKRSDVMAMNSAMIVGTLIAASLLVFGWQYGWFPYDRLWPVLFWSASVAAIGLFLIVDNIILARQAIRVARSYMRDLDAAMQLREALRL